MQRGDESDPLLLFHLFNIQMCTGTQLSSKSHFSQGQLNNCFNFEHTSLNKGIYELHTGIHTQQWSQQLELQDFPTFLQTVKAKVFF